MLTLTDVRHALVQYGARYRYLDVFAADVRDLHSVNWVSQGSAFETSEGQVGLRVELLANGVLRFSRTPFPPPEVVPALAGAAIGAAIGAAGDSKEAVLGGALLGLLVGAIVGEAVQMNRVMALRLDETRGRWTVYDGPLLNWVKDQLAPE